MYGHPGHGGKGKGGKGGPVGSDRGHAPTSQRDSGCGGGGYGGYGSAGGSRGGFGSGAVPSSSGRQDAPRPSDRSGGYPSDQRGGHSSSRGSFSGSGSGGRSAGGNDRPSFGDRSGDRGGPGRGGDRPGDRMGGDRDRMGGDRDRDRDRTSGGDRRDGRSGQSGGDRGYGSRNDPPPRGGGGYPDRGSGAGGIAGRATNAVPPPSSVGGPPSGGMPPLHVSGCSNDTVSNIIQGMYATKEQNHGKPVYKKEGAPGSVTVLIYYWDERDGPAFNGWWFGPKVGGDQVWAYNGGNLGKDNVMPPTGSWKVPWDGKIDDRLKITFTSHGHGGHGGHGGHSGHGGAVPSSANRADGRMSREDEDRRRRDADRERQRQAAEEKRRRDKEEEEERRREEARRRLQREEEQRRRDEEMRRKRQEEERKQEAAANNVRKVLDRIRVATPDNIKELQAELDRAAAANFQAMGSLRDRVNDEMQNTLTQAQKRIAEEIKEREEAERRRQAEIARVTQLVKEAAADIDSSEAKVAEAQASSKAACTKGADPDAVPKEILAAVEEASKELVEAKTSLDRSEKVLAAKVDAMGHGEGSRHVKREVDELQSRIHGSQRALTRSTENLEEAQAKGTRRAASHKQDQEWKACFTRHDADGDGRLSRAEVASFSLAEFGFALPEDVLSKIMRVLEPVGFEKIVPLRQKVGIGKSEAEARAKRAQEEEQKRLADEKRHEVQQSVDDMTSKIEDCKAKLAQAEDTLKGLSKDAEISSEAVAAGTSKAEAQAQEVRDILAEVSSQMQNVEAAIADIPEVKRLVRQDISWLQDQHKRTEAHVEKVTGLVKESRDAAAQKAEKEVTKLRAQVIAAIRTAMSAKGKSGEELFDEINSGSSLTCEILTTYLKGLEGLEEVLGDSAKAERLFADLAGGAESEVTKEMFLEMLRLYFKCVKGTVLSEDICIKSKTVRRLEVGEVLEVLEGPSKDDGANVQRVRCLAVGDGATGWATIAGNQGTPFLVQGGNIFWCVLETPITSSADEGDEAAQEVRKLAVGEAFEVLEFQRKDASANGARRARGKAKQDGASGWATITDKDGNAILESR